MTSLAKGNRCSRSYEGSKSLCLALDVAFTERVVWISCLLSPGSAPCTPLVALCAAGSLFPLASGSVAASLSSVSTATPSTNKSQRCLHQTLRRRDWTPFGSGHPPEKQREKTALEIWGGTGWCLTLLFHSLAASVTNSVTGQSMPAALLNVLHFNRIPLGCDHSKAEPQRYKGSIAWGVLCSAFFHNNNNGVREPCDPRRFWSWHVRLRYSPIPTSSPPLSLSPPLISLPLALSEGSLPPIQRAICFTPSFNTQIDERRWDSGSSIAEL